MNTPVAFRRPAPESGFSTSPGLSSAADLVGNHLQEWRQSFGNAESLHGAALREMQDAFLDCREEDWDGYGALPVSNTTFLRAREFLDQILSRVPAPTVCATPGGSMVFEWIVSPRRRFLVSIGDDDCVAYAGVFGSDPVHGTATVGGDLPLEIMQHLNRLYLG